MNLTPEKFEAQMVWLKTHDYHFIPLKDAVAFLLGERSSLPDKPVVITVDDGWESDYTYFYPIAKKYDIPMTLFIYPSTISQGKNALTWDQLKELQATGLFDIESHTYSHPNFKQMRKRLSPENYAKFVTKELTQSKQQLDEKLNVKVTLLAWPFGIYDRYLEESAKKAGYTMALTIDYKRANRDFRPMAEPRFMIIDSQSMKTFAGLVGG